MNGYLQLIAVAIGSTVATKLSGYFITFGVGPFFSIILSAFVAVIIYFAFVESPNYCSFLRSRTDPRAKCEGVWMQTIDKDNKRFYSLVRIIYKDRLYIIKGTACDHKGNIHSTWKSTMVNIDIKKGEILYFYEADMCDGSGETVIGYGLMRLDEDLKEKQYTRGVGYFVDARTKLLQCEYTIDRLTTEDIEKFINKKNIYTNDDVKELVVKYHETYGNRRGISQGR